MFHIPSYTFNLTCKSFHILSIHNRFFIYSEKINLSIHFQLYSFYTLTALEQVTNRFKQNI
ncbi:hypothetical protein AZ270_gp76 [Acidianus tailed spindle virus]|uniref:hypothetical protein n=1 Tax=Acidianus tailed spindle virus TaxID=1797140 RepID=UPI00076F3034|nr:hypothetical protein AZ270_gp76 [Acidianus tailed spindle virus]AME30099.1 hypothetical protein ATSV_F60b [Acidianus tailed spindle virus]